MKLVLGIVNKQKADHFSHILSSLKYQTDHITIEFSEDGIYSQGMGFDHISLFELRLQKEWFDFYEFNEGDSRVISLSSTIVQKVFSTRQEKQSVSISFDGEVDKISITFKNPHPVKSDIPKEFVVTLMDVEFDRLEIPNADYSAEFSIHTKTFSSIVEQLEIFNEQIRVICTDERIEFTASGIEGSMSVNLYNDNIDYVTEYMSEEDLNLSILFSNKYFQSFCKFAKISKEVTLSFSDAFPMQMYYPLQKSIDNEGGDIPEPNDDISTKSY